MRVTLLFIGTFNASTQILIEDLARKAYPGVSVDIQKYRYGREMNKAEINRSYVLLISHLRNAQTPLILLDRPSMNLFEPLLPEDIPTKTLMVYRSDKQVDSDLKKKWHLTQGLICKDENVETLLDENIALRQQMSDVRTTESPQLSQVQKELEYYKQLYEMQRSQSMFGDDFSNLQNRYDRLVEESKRDKNSLQTANRKLTKLMDDLSEAKQKLRREYNKGYDEGRADAEKNKKPTDIFDALRNVKDISGRRLPKITYTGKYEYVHLLYSATARTELSVYKAIQEDLQDKFSESKTSYLFIDLSNEGYGSLALGMQKPYTEAGSQWLQNPSYKTLHRYLNKTRFQWLSMMTPTYTGLMTTIGVLQWNWQNILSNLNESGLEVYIYLGKLFTSENMIIYNSTCQLVAENILYLDATVPYEAGYAMQAMQSLQNPKVLGVNAYKVTPATGRILQKELAKVKAEYYEVEYDFYKMRGKGQVM